LDKVAVVLWRMLVPLIFVTSGAKYYYGYSSKNNPAQILIAKLFKMHTNALTRNAKVMCCIKRCIDILTHPLVEPYAKANTL
jgi:hypothetical protein